MESPSDIEHVFGSGEILSKEQSLFYEHSREIRNLQAEFDLLSKKIKSSTLRLQQLYVPFLNQFQAYRIEQTLLLADCFDKMKFSKYQKRALQEVVVMECISILNNNPEQAELKLLYRSFTGKEYLPGLKEEEEENLRGSFKDFFEFSTQSKTSEDLDEEEPEWEKQKKAAQEKRKAKKQEVQKKAENFSLKEVYRNLLKAYHPDKELEEEKKAEKTEITKKIIQAYEREDLYSLLTYEISLLENARDRMAGIAKEKLALYNKMLLENKKALKQKIEDLKSSHADVYAHMCAPNTNAERYLKRIKKDLQEDLEGFRQQLMHLRGNKEVVDFFAESYLQEKRGEGVQRFYY